MDIISKYLKDSRDVNDLDNYFKNINDKEILRELYENFTSQMNDIDELSIIYKTRYRYLNNLFQKKMN